ncbi:GDSL esterase/lipase At5g03610-like [Rutidosis leptorrhynchoides]|uniref:GDSL esterase/lipase At5g03610-like n=1 Tax=Rutidosis leptorrhynchoides TaxID=125765 RepID=UPI003A995C82
MKHQASLVLIYLFISITNVISYDIFLGSNKRHNQNHNLKLFVFGDSYADTGNWPKSYGGSWHEPYGITFPGSPSGRFSDGRVLTDYIAGILGTKSPITYKGWKSGEKKSTKYGMNFAYGGTGVFNTFVNQPNMTTQVDFFEQFVQQTQLHLNYSSSIAIISLAGNDYATYFTSNHTLEDLPGLTKSVVNQVISNVKRIHELGVRKFAITAMQPLGCLPQFTIRTSFQNCSDTENSVAEFHNQVLTESINKLNNETDDKSIFVILNLYQAFSSALNLQRKSLSTGSSNSNLLEPCCQGVSKGYSCGNVEDGTRILKYRVCENRTDSFFWDMIHPSQQGWHEVSMNLRSSLMQLV